MKYENNPTTESSDEFWAMYSRMIKQIGGGEESQHYKTCS